MVVILIKIMGLSSMGLYAPGEVRHLTYFFTSGDADLTDICPQYADQSRNIRVLVRYHCSVF